MANIGEKYRFEDDYDFVIIHYRKGQFKEVSRFIVEGKLNDMPVDTYGYEVGNKVAHKTYGIGEIEQLKEDKITISFDNTLRSFSLKVLIDNNLIEKVE